MPYRLRADETVQEGVRRCAREQLDRAIDELSTGVERDPVTAVHDARKALKKSRSLLRLSRASLDREARRRENRTLRDAGRSLSGTRDADVMLQAVDDLADRFTGQLPQTTFDTIRRHLETERAPAPSLTGEVTDELKAARARIDDWPLRRGGWKRLKPGLLRTYRQGRSALGAARREPTVENFHEWRKRVKDLWYDLRLLKPLAPGIVGGQADEAHRLSDLLGDDHDLAVLGESLQTGAGALAVDLDAVIGLIDRRREELQSEALRVGERLYAESPKAFRRRMHRYWKARQPAPALA